MECGQETLKTRGHVYITIEIIMLTTNYEPSNMVSNIKPHSGLTRDHEISSLCPQPLRGQAGWRFSKPGHSYLLVLISPREDSEEQLKLAAMANVFAAAVSIIFVQQYPHLSADRHTKKAETRGQPS